MNTRSLNLVFVVALLALTLGCSRSGRLTGTVMYQDRPVVSGTVTLVASDGVTHQAIIHPDGSFELTGVSSGIAKVAITSPDPVQQAKQIEAVQRSRASGTTQPKKSSPQTAAAPTGWFPLPDRFADPEQSGITLDIRGGRNTLPIALTD